MMYDALYGRQSIEKKDSISAVSYTHLFYDRTVHTTLIMVSIEMEMLEHCYMYMAILPEYIEIIPVSYTHLDVYKRQEGSKAQLMENMTAALPFMDEDLHSFAERTLQKISPLTENEYAELAIFAADEV